MLSFHLLLFLLLSLCLLSASEKQTDLNRNGSVLAGLESSPSNSFTGGSLPSACGKATPTAGGSFASSLKLHLRHHHPQFEMNPNKMIAESTQRDLNRITTTMNFNNTRRRITESVKKKNQIPLGLKLHRHLLQQNTEKKKKNDNSTTTLSHIQVMATLKSGVSLGSGEYFIEVYIGTPPKKFQLIVDTGSDLTWIQCLPCHNCFNQTEPFYNPNTSTSFQSISRHDSRCRLVTPSSTQSSSSSNCTYFYWYGDSSNTTGDFALETFTLLNHTNEDNNNSQTRIENVMFGCGHSNRGLFHGAAGLIGLGRGPLSFTTQLLRSSSLDSQSFSYCLVGWNSGPDSTSKLIFGDDDENQQSSSKMNFTAISVRKETESSIDHQTFYYVEIKSILIGGEVVNIPESNWRVKNDGSGGVIVDSGTTLSYFLQPMYEVIKDAFVKRVRGVMRRVEDFLVLSPCYEVVEEDLDQLPSFGIKFSDGTEWNFPVENYFVQVSEDVVCLAMLGTPNSSDFSIIGNYLQQNFRVLYDLKRSRIGFAPAKCDHM